MTADVTDKTKIGYFDKLYSLYELYDNVKKAIILCENFDPDSEMYIAPINQLRSALDHIFKAIVIADDTDKSDYEFKEAKEHLDRAGYDALELLVANLGGQIICNLNKYSVRTITAVCPEYYTEIKPKLTEVRQIVADLRAEKKISVDKSFLEYFGQIEGLIEIDKRVNKLVPSLEEYERKLAEDENKQNSKQIFIAAVAAIIGSVVTYLFTCIFRHN